MGYLVAQRRVTKRASRAVCMRECPRAFYSRLSRSALLYLAKKEGLAPGDVGGPEAVPENPKALISVLRKHFKGTHLKKNTYKAVNTEAGKRLRVRMSDWKCSLASVQPLLANGVPLDLAALSKLSPADGSVMTGCLQSMLRNAMCGLVATIPLAVGAGVYAASAFVGTYQS
mmetsp:Transcript_33072/g.82260  ORF Transcript_33072/g.82260 Transcript_33072/m.82260 type:complete len:172 (+) Transcript_33072:204-719(+)